MTLILYQLLGLSFLLRIIKSLCYSQLRLLHDSQESSFVDSCASLFGSLWRHEHVPCTCPFVLLSFCLCVCCMPCTVLNPPFHNSKIPLLKTGYITFMSKIITIPIFGIWMPTHIQTILGIPTFWILNSISFLFFWILWWILFVPIFTTLAAYSLVLNIEPCSQSFLIVIFFSFFELILSNHEIKLSLRVLVIMYLLQLKLGGFPSYPGEHHTLQEGYSVHESLIQCH